jgi:TFIIH basal transcription factor complex TTD-A subunit
MIVVPGTLITCDPPVKQIILRINEDGPRCVIEDLDDTHLLVKTSELDRIRSLVDVQLEENTWRPPADESNTAAV